MKVPPYLKDKARLNKLFGKTTSYETEDEIMDAILGLACDLSPENLTCDGELDSRSVNIKRKEIMVAWNYLESKLGREVSEDEAWAWRHKKDSK